jgi:hypothetical protein
MTRLLVFLHANATAGEDIQTTQLTSIPELTSPRDDDEPYISAYRVTKYGLRQGACPGRRRQGHR